jgi:hypothetical protein
MFIILAQTNYVMAACKPAPTTYAKHGMTASQYQSAFNTYSTQRKYRLTDISVHKYGNKTRFSAIWEINQGLYG